MRLKYMAILFGAAVLFGGGYAAWIMLSPAQFPPGFAKSNGRLEAERVDIATPSNQLTSITGHSFAPRDSRFADRHR